MAKICLDAGHGGRDSGAVGFGKRRCVEDGFESWNNFVRQRA